MRTILTLAAALSAFIVGALMLAQVLGFTSPWLMLLLMFDLMGIAKLAEPLFVLRMPRALREVRLWERSGDVYRRLAVRPFGRFLRNSPLRYLNAGVYVSAAGDDLRHLYRRVASGEATHFWAAVLFTPYIGFLYLTGRPGVATLFLFIQLAMNVWPILHLRSVRGRLDVLLSSQQMRQRKPPTQTTFPDPPSRRVAEADNRPRFR
jgi:hypothetical protein